MTKSKEVGQLLTKMTTINTVFLFYRTTCFYIHLHLYLYLPFSWLTNAFDESVPPRTDTYSVPILFLYRRKNQDLREVDSNLRHSSQPLSSISFSKYFPPVRRRRNTSGHRRKETNQDSRTESLNPWLRTRTVHQRKKSERVGVPATGKPQSETENTTKVRRLKQTGNKKKVEPTEGT